MTDLPTCKHCGAEVLWVKREGGSGWHPPLVTLGRVIALNDKREAVIVDAYTRHRCDPADIERHQALEERLAEGRAEAASRARDAAESRRLQAAVSAEFASQRAAERVSLQEQAWRSAKRVKCPKCDAPAKKKCLNLNTVRGIKGRPGGSKKYTSWPHPERTLLAEKENP